MKTKKILILILILASAIRLIGLKTNPVSLFGDELDVGYHAYSILKTGRDYSGNFMPLHFQSLAEWRTPLYLYSAVPTVALFGISPLGVRLPAAIFGIASLYVFYLLVIELASHFKFRQKEEAAILSTLILTLSPWHIQYSRAGFEVTLLLLFLFLGLLAFLRSLKSSKNLWVAVSFFVLTPLIYSTAKLFTPFFMALIFLIWKKDILGFPKKVLKKAIIIGFILGIPVVYSSLLGGGAQRFSYISIFTNPTTEPEVGVLRLRDARMRGEMGTGLQPTFIDRAVHNKFSLWEEKIMDNYINAFSADFLFLRGDPNPRHSLPGIGQFYNIEFFALLLALIFFFGGKGSLKFKLFLAFWAFLSAFPSAITRDGGNHATRLILLLPPLVMIIAYGGVSFLASLKGNWRKIFIVGYSLFWFTEAFLFYHQYKFHYPWDSERWWHAGWKGAVGALMENQNNFDRVFITMKDEPAWIFFAAHSSYPPNKWHEGFPMKNTEVAGFGGLSYIDKYYFGSPDEEGISIYDLPKFITQKDLYLASAKEIPHNLIMDPTRVPIGLSLIKAIPFPSGEPAFYLLTKE